MAEIASAYVSLLPSAKGFGRATESQVSGEMKTSGGRVGKTFGTALKVGAGAALGGAALAVGFLKGSLDEAREAQKVGALTVSTIKATGGAAGVTAKQVGDLAGALSLKTGIDDETIQSGQNMLLTFKNIRNEVGKGNDIFNQTSKTLVDMSAAMGTDPKQAAIQLGKALNDPIKGVSALSRVGVTFTEQQKAQIKTLVDSGKTIDAQKIVLKELNSEFGGAAAAQATAGDKARVAWGNLQETVGTAVLPIWDRMLTAFASGATLLSQNIGPAISTVSGLFSGASNSLGGSGGFAAGFQQIVAFAKQAAPAILAFGKNIGTQLLPAAKAAGKTFSTVILPGVLSLGRYLSAKLLPVFAQVAGVIQSKVVPIIAELARFFYTTLYPAILEIVKAVLKNLQPVFDSLVQAVQTQILPALVKLLDKFREWQPTIQKVIVVVVKVVGFILKLASAILGKVLPVVIKLAAFLIGRVVVALIKVVSAIIKVVGFLVKLVAGYIRVISAVVRFEIAVLKAVGRVVSFMVSVPGKIIGALASLAGKLLDLGRTAFGKLKDAATDKVGDLFSFLKGLPGRIAGLAGEFLGAGKTLGSKIISGLMEGLRAVGGFVGDLASAIKNAVNSALHLPVTIKGPGPLPDFTIPAFARGTNYAPGGLTLVGEQGPELVNLPRGSKVSTASQTRAALRGGQSGMAVFHIYDSDGTLITTMRGVAQEAIDDADLMGAQIARAR